MSKKVRWGILSTARIGREQMIPALKNGELTDVVAIASREGNRAQDAAAEFGIPKAYASYEALLADPEIDAVYNPLPNHLHAPLTIKALDAGKHVLCEKPIALNAEEAKQIEAAQRRSGKLVAEAFMVRFHPQWQRAREIASSGRLGDVRAIHTFFSYHLTDPDNIRNHPLLRGMNIPKTGQANTSGVVLLVTKTLVIMGDPQVTTTPEHPRGAMLRAYDKQTGQQVGAVLMPAPQSGSPMTYSHNGRQYIVVAVGGGNVTGEYLAFALPEASTTER